MILFSDFDFGEIPKMSLTWMKERTKQQDLEDVCHMYHQRIVVTSLKVTPPEVFQNVFRSSAFRLIYHIAIYHGVHIDTTIDTALFLTGIYMYLDGGLKYILFSPLGK